MIHGDMDAKVHLFSDYGKKMSLGVYNYALIELTLGNSPY